MDLNRVRQLAGLEVLAESKEQLNEQTKEVSVKVALQTAGPGLVGDMMNIPKGPFAEMLAEILGIPKGWKLTKIGKGYAAYQEDDQLCFFASKSDFSEDEYDEDQSM